MLTDERYWRWTRALIFIRFFFLISSKGWVDNLLRDADVPWCLGHLCAPVVLGCWGGTGSGACQWVCGWQLGGAGVLVRWLGCRVDEAVCSCVCYAELFGITSCSVVAACFVSGCVAYLERCGEYCLWDMS